MRGSSRFTISCQKGEGEGTVNKTLARVSIQLISENVPYARLVELLRLSVLFVRDVGKAKAETKQTVRYTKSKKASDLYVRNCLTMRG